MSLGNGSDLLTAVQKPDVYRLFLKVNFLSKRHALLSTKLPSDPRSPNRGFCPKVPRPGGPSIAVPSGNSASRRALNARFEVPDHNISVYTVIVFPVSDLVRVVLEPLFIFFCSDLQPDHHLVLLALFQFVVFEARSNADAVEFVS